MSVDPELDDIGYFAHGKIVRRLSSDQSHSINEEEVQAAIEGAGVCVVGVWFVTVRIFGDIWGYLCGAATHARAHARVHTLTQRKDPHC